VPNHSVHASKVFLLMSAYHHSAKYGLWVFLCCLLKQTAISTPKTLTMYFTQIAKNAYIGALVEGIVTDIQPYGVHIRIKNTDMR
jgi:hypothetical protein